MMDREADVAVGSALVSRTEVSLIRTKEMSRFPPAVYVGLVNDTAEREKLP